MKAYGRSRASERGEGQVQSIVMLVVFILLALAAKDMGPMYWENYNFEEKLKEIAGRFPPNKDGDLRAQAAVKGAIESEGLARFLTPEQCEVTSQGGIGGIRSIKCIYTREYKLFGSIKRKQFEIIAERPMF
jgi:hypothetical protein